MTKIQLEREEKKCENTKREQMQTLDKERGERVMNGKEDEKCRTED